MTLVSYSNETLPNLWNLAKEDLLHERLTPA